MQQKDCRSFRPTGLPVENFDVVDGYAPVGNTGRVSEPPWQIGEACLAEGSSKSSYGAGAEQISAGVANSGNAVIGWYPRLSPLPVTLISLLYVCNARFGGLRRIRLGVWAFFLTKPLWQVIQSRLSMTGRCRELRQVCARRSGSRFHPRVKGRLLDRLNGWDDQCSR
jgi:hypothetical protein